MKRLLLLAALCAALATPVRATLTTTTSVAQYTSNGVTTVYSYPYRFLDQSHLVVTKTDLSAVTTTLVLGTDYTVTGANLTAGGSVTLTVAIPNNWILKIKRSTPKTQTCNFRNVPAQGPAVESCLDRLTMIAQEMNDGTFTSLITTPITTAQATIAAPSTVPNTSNTNVAGTSSAFAAADHLHALAVGPMLGASTAAGQSIPSAVQTIVVFGTVELDTDSGYSAGTGRYTVPAGKGGHYEITGQISWSAPITTTAAVSIFKNAAQVKVFNQINPSTNQSEAVTAILNLAAGDIIDIRALQSSGGASPLQAAAVDNYFSLKRIQ